MSVARPRKIGTKDGGSAVIRSAAEADAPALLALTRSVLEERGFMVTAPDEFVMTEETEREWIQQHRRRRRWLAIVAVADGEVVGVLNFKNGHRRRLAHHGVAHDWRGRGLGDALLVALLDWAEENRSLEKVSLAVLSTNAPAIALYRKHGFVEEGRRVREVKYTDGTYADDILMCRFIEREL